MLKGPSTTYCRAFLTILKKWVKKGPYTCSTHPRIFSARLFSDFEKWTKKMSIF